MNTVLKLLFIFILFTAVKAQAAPCQPINLTVADGISNQSVPCNQDAITLSAMYPGDIGMATDSNVVWYENFENTLPNITSRYNDVLGVNNMSLSSDKPEKSTGTKSIKFYADANATTTHLYKNFANSSYGYDELWVRYYVKYANNVYWHHSSVWFGGYYPPLNYPHPRAGTKPAGNDRFSIAFEPYTNGTVANPQFDFYNYWMQMHSWMSSPSGSTAYYGNSLLHNTSVVATDNTWICLEIHLKLNTDMSSTAGAVLDLWVNDAPIQQYIQTSPLGYWIRDKFCPSTTTDKACTDYKTSSTPLETLNQQYRNTSNLKLNYIWLQNYITSNPGGNLWYDDLVVAKKRIGCIL